MQMFNTQTHKRYIRVFAHLYKYVANSGVDGKRRRRRRRVTDTDTDI